MALIAVRFFALFDSLVNFVYCEKPKIAMIIKKVATTKSSIIVKPFRLFMNVIIANLVTNRYNKGSN